MMVVQVVVWVVFFGCKNMRRKDVVGTCVFHYGTPCGEILLLFIVGVWCHSN